MELSSRSRACAARRRTAFTLGAFLTMAGLPVTGAQALAGDQVAARPESTVHTSVSAEGPEPYCGPASSSDGEYYRYVEFVYSDLLERAPDDVGMNTWLSLMFNQGWQRAAPSTIAVR